MTTVVAEKDPDTPATYDIDIFDAIVEEARRRQEYAVDDVTRAPRDTGFYYVCTKAGRTAHQYPVWPRAAAGTVLDGSVEWTCTDPADATPPTIASVDWTVPAALTVDSQQDFDHVARVTLSGGIAGEDYEVTARITPTSGPARDVTITVPVRQQ